MSSVITITKDQLAELIKTAVAEAVASIEITPKSTKKARSPAPPDYPKQVAGTYIRWCTLYRESKKPEKVTVEALKEAWIEAKEKKTKLYKQAEAAFTEAKAERDKAVASYKESHSPASSKSEKKSPKTEPETLSDEELEE